MNIKITNDQKEEEDSFKAEFKLSEHDMLREIVVTISGSGQDEEEARKNCEAAIAQVIKLLEFELT